MPNDSISFENARIINGSFVNISDDDTTYNTLSEKLAEGDGINLTILNSGGNEQIEISVEGGSGSDDEEFIVNFNYLSSYPITICNVSPIGTVTSVRLSIDTIFDGTTSMSVGVAGNDDILMDTLDNNVNLSASYITSPYITLGNGELVRLYSSLIGTTQGEGRVIVNVTR